MEGSLDEVNELDAVKKKRKAVVEVPVEEVAEMVVEMVWAEERPSSLAKHRMEQAKEKGRANDWRQTKRRHLSE